MLRRKHIKLLSMTLFKELPFLNENKLNLYISLQYLRHDIGYIDYFIKKCSIKKYKTSFLTFRGPFIVIYSYNKTYEMH